ncbi:MAG: hypothetical protein ACP5TO_08235, partial [Thermoplasmata archaeon]
YDHKANTTVIIDYIKDAETELLMIQNGETDIAVGLPTTYYPTLSHLESSGVIKIYEFLQSI